MAGATHETVSAREAEVRSAIAKVRDPEIDETVAALNFIVGVDIEGDDVTVTLRLPTFWCPANFVFLMGGDIGDAVRALPWVRQFRFELIDHFAAEEISRSISEGRSFAKTFPGLARNELDDLRLTFDRKAFLMRQGALVDALRRAGFSDQFLAQATVAHLEEAAPTGGELAILVADYLEKRVGLGLGTAPDDPAVTTPDGEPVAASDLNRHLREARKVTMNAQANGEMCRMLMSARLANGACAAHGHATPSEKERTRWMVPSSN